MIYFELSSVRLHLFVFFFYFILFGFEVKKSGTRSQIRSFSRLKKIENVVVIFLMFVLCDVDGRSSRSSRSEECSVMIRKEDERTLLAILMRFQCRFRRKSKRIRSTYFTTKPSRILYGEYDAI